MRKAKPIKVRKGEKVVLLSGGNPQIAKADGDAPVQAYIAAMPGWKSDLGKRLDALIVRSVPKAVRWNLRHRRPGLVPVVPCPHPLRQGDLLQRHVAAADPTRWHAEEQGRRWLDIYEGDELDEAQVATWVKQAAALPGWVP